MLALDADAAALAAALGDALLGRRSARAQASGRREQAPNGRAPAQKTPEAPRGEVITVSSAGTPDGRTAAVAVPLAYYALRLVPYLMETLPYWRRRVLRPRVPFEDEEFDLHGV